MKKVFIVGKSKKLITLIKEIHKTNKVINISWRELDVCKKFPTTSNSDIVYLVGFHYKSLQHTYNKLIDCNVKLPLRFISKILGTNIKIIYINTKMNSKRYTFSRYYFSKVQLSNQLLQIHPNFININVGTIVDKNDNPLIHGSHTSRFVFKILIKLGLVDKINTEQLKDLIMHSNKTMNGYINLKLIFPNLPRNIFWDRVLRFIFG